MNNNFKETWEIYVASWKADTETEKRKLFKKALDPNCQYHDPLTKTKGWDELVEYMLAFHQQIPGGYFATKSFFAHSNKSVATWDMKNGDMVIGNGISYAEYNDQGVLVSMTGFFEPPQG